MRFLGSFLSKCPGALCEVVNHPASFCYRLPVRLRLLCACADRLLPRATPSPARGREPQQAPCLKCPLFFCSSGFPPQDNVSLEEAALLEPLNVALAAVRARLRSLMLQVWCGLRSGRERKE